jgi:hypothetical protein
MDSNKDGNVSSIELQRAVEKLLGKGAPLNRTTKLEMLRQVCERKVQSLAFDMK